MSFVVNENSSFNLTISIKDSSGNILSDISSLEWWVGSQRSKEPVLEKQTESSPKPEMTINIPQAANTCSFNRDEAHFVIIKVTAVGNKVKHQIFSYNVRSLDLVPYPA